MSYSIYEQYVDLYYGFTENNNIDFEALKTYVINKLKNEGISGKTKQYLARRKWDRTNDYMLDNTDAVESYIKRSRKPDFKHACAVLLEGKY